MAEQPIQSIEKLQVRHTELNKKKIQTETQCENAKRELDALQKQAMENYGTHDVAALTAKLEQITTENHEKRAAYQSHLDAIETQLRQVEAQFTQGGAG